MTESRRESVANSGRDGVAAFGHELTADCWCKPTVVRVELCSLEEARRTADILAPQFGAPSPLVRVLRAIADDHERLTLVLREIAVEVKLTDDLPVETQIATLWRVVRHHSEIAREALSGD